jgi:hypothetical protein
VKTPKDFFGTPFPRRSHINPTSTNQPQEKGFRRMNDVRDPVNAVRPFHGTKFADWRAELWQMSPANQGNHAVVQNLRSTVREPRATATASRNRGEVKMTSSSANQKEGMF